MRIITRKEIFMILSCQNISKSFGTDEVLNKISFHIEDYEKAAVIGINGAGKSTLLKIIMGEMTPDDGQVVLSKGKTIGYLSQLANVSSGNTIYEELLEVKKDVIDLYHKMKTLEAQMQHAQGDALTSMLDTYARLTHEYESANGYAYKSEITGVLIGLGFTEDEFSKPVDTLSGGQKTRVCLGKLLLSKPDLILLDEPTNHLDMESITALNNGMIKFPGVILFSSRDHQIVQTTANRIMEIMPNGQMIDKITTYDEYLESDEMARKRQTYSTTAEEEEDD